MSKPGSLKDFDVNINIKLAFLWTAVTFLGCFGYLINFLGHTLRPDYSQLGISSYVALPASIGEIGTCLWLLVMGAKENRNLVHEATPGS